MKLTSMSAILTPVTTGPVRMAWPLSPATAVLATQAVSVKLTSTSVSANPARMGAHVKTGKTLIFVSAPKGLQVRPFTNMKLLILSEFCDFICIYACQSTGFNCEVNLDDCKSKPCDYGRCIDKINGYECACEPGYTGEQWAGFSMKGTVPWALGGVGRTGGWRVHSGGTMVSDCTCGIVGIERRTESNLIHTQCTNFVCSLKRV